MSKYQNEFKLQVIKYYLEELHSYPEYCKEFNIPSYTPIKNWVERYKMYGVEGILKKLNALVQERIKRENKKK